METHTNILVEVNRLKKPGDRKYIRIENYDEWVKTINPLDLIAFGPLDCRICSCQCWVSQSIRTMETLYQCRSARWVHVGIALPGFMISFPNCDPNEMYILESIVSRRFKVGWLRKLTGMDGVVDVVSGQGKSGVQVRVLRDVIAKMDGVVAAIHLKPGYLESKNFHTVTNELQTWFDRYYSVKYDCLHLFQAMFRVQCSKCCVDPDVAMFCSEMATHLYKHLGWIINTVMPEQINPQSLVDFTNMLNAVYDIFEYDAHTFVPRLSL